MEQVNQDILARRVSRLALAVIALLIAALTLWGLQILAIPKMYLIARRANPLLFYEGEILIAVSLLLAWNRNWAAGKLVWICQAMHRWISALCMLGILGAEASMHILNIPHMEGWWLPMLGSGALATTAAAWFQNLRTHSSHSHLNENP